jgi:hypothetical protein
MTHYTQLPKRRFTTPNRISSNYSSLDEDALPTAALLSRLQAEFDKDETRMNQNILFYQDIAIGTRQKQVNRVRFLPTSTEGLMEDEQWKPSGRIKYPPTPAKPSPSTIARMMDISYTSWSSSSYQDTTADSKLAEWLASFAVEENNGANPDISTRNPFIVHVTEPSSYRTSGGEKLSMIKSSSLATGTRPLHPTPWRPAHRRAISQPLYSDPLRILSSSGISILQMTPDRARGEQSGFLENYTHTVISDYPSEEENIAKDEQILNAPFTPSLDSDAGSSPLFNYTPVIATTRKSTLNQKWKFVYV